MYIYTYPYKLNSWQGTRSRSRCDSHMIYTKQNRNKTWKMMMIAFILTLGEIM